MANEDLLTAGKIAEKIGASAAKVKKAIVELNMEPDITKGACKYYGPTAVEKIINKIVDKIEEQR